MLQNTTNRERATVPLCGIGCPLVYYGSGFRLCLAAFVGALRAVYGAAVEVEIPRSGQFHKVHGVFLAADGAGGENAVVLNADGYLFAVGGFALD